MEASHEDPVRKRSPRSPVGARLVLWLVISAAALVVIPLVMFAVIEAARPLIGPISDDSLKERLLVAGSYAAWFALTASVSVIAWRRLLSR